LSGDIFICITAKNEQPLFLIKGITLGLRYLAGVLIQPGLQGKSERVQFFHAVPLYFDAKLSRNSPPVIVQSPEEIETDINKENEENSLLKTRRKVLTGKLLSEQQPEKPVKLIYYNYNEKGIEQVSNTDGDPAKKSPLNIRNDRVNAVGIIIFHPSGVPGGPFDENSQDNQQYPAPAFHQPAKQTGNEFLQMGVILNLLGIRLLN
jgi:hypothetical protein